MVLRSIKRNVLRRLAVRDNVTFGADFHVGPGSILWAPRSLKIGNNVYVGKNVTIQVDGVIGDHVMIANNVGIVGREDHDIRQRGMSVREADWVGENAARLSAPVSIGADVWLGYGSIVLSGVKVGDSAVVAAGSVVTKNIPANVVVAGIPAREIGTRFAPQDFDEHWRLLAERHIRKIEEMREE